MIEFKWTKAVVGALALSMLMSFQPIFAESSKDPINIGALNPLTGSGSVYGVGMLEAIKVAIDQINVAGGPLGRQFKLFNADDQSDPNAAVFAAEKLVNVNKVRAILGTYASAITLAVQPIAIRNDVIIMNTSGAPAVSKKGPLSFQFNPREHLYGEAMAELAHKRGFKTAGILSMNNPAGQGMAEFFQERFEKLGGKITIRVDYQEKQTSYRAELNQVLNTQPDVILLPAYTPEAAVIIKEASVINPKMKWIGPAFAFNQRLIDMLGAEITNGLLGIDSIPAKDARSYAYLAKEYSKRMGADLFGNVYAAMTYDMTNMLALSIEKAGNTTSEDIIKAMHEISGHGGVGVSSFAEGRDALKRGEKIDYQGASGPLKFNATNNRGVFFGVFELTGGKPVMLDVIDESTP
ncbi:MAG: ABC transporter substrate-binding protein [Rhizobiales bacterium]|nr:ABC transporter substrate-binding protein [Hyphomicrobiales bacterium]